MKYLQAVKKWNEQRQAMGKGQSYCIPRKGTEDHAEVVKMMGADAPKPKVKKVAITTAPTKKVEAPVLKKVEAPVVKKFEYTVKQVEPHLSNSFRSINDPDYFKNATSKQRTEHYREMFGLGDKKFVKYMKPHLLKRYTAWCKKNNLDCDLR